MNGQDFVYLVGIVPGPQFPYVKIGYAQDVWQRLMELQCGNPFELRVLSFLPGGQEVEGSIHVALAAHRVRGEWFDLGNDPLKVFTDAYRGRAITTLLRPIKTTPFNRSAQAQKQAYDLYFDMRNGDVAPSQNAFEAAWRKAGYGLKTDDIRALYKEIHTKVTGNNP
jgi:hypothetical protein